MARPERLTVVAALAILLVGVVAGVESLTIARRSPGYSFAATSGLAAALELAAGWALVLAGLIAFRTRGRRAFGGILALAGVAWFLVEWNNPGASLAVVFTAGLVGYACTPCWSRTLCCVIPTGASTPLSQPRSPPVI
jgi:hypothetical protein